MGVYLKNENKLEEMVSIMETLQQDVPHIWKTTSLQVPGSDRHETLHQDTFCRTLFGGDQLTTTRGIGAQRIRANSEDGVDRLQGLVPVVEDWHAKVVLLGVSLRLCMCSTLTIVQYMYLF